jgi:hypothetical protein
MFMRVRVSFGIGALLLLCQAVHATTIVPVTFRELVQNADVIFVGEVVGQRASWDMTRDGRSIVTSVQFNVVRVLKGNVGLVTQLDFLGGTIGDLTMDVSGVPRFQSGDRDVLFVGAVRNAVSPLIGFSQGRFRIERDAVSGFDRVRTYDGRALDATSTIGKPRSTSLAAVKSTMRLSDFEAEVRTEAATRQR